MRLEAAPLARTVANRKINLLAREVAQPVGRDQLQID
jgi:hypothetical protein